MSLRKKLVMGAAVVLSVSAVAVSAFAATEETAVVVGNESLKPGEVIEVLQSSAGGNPMMVGLMLTQATLADRVEMVKQMADAMLFAEGARISGLADREDVALKLKWQRMQLLLEAYLQEISKKWDMSDKAGPIKTDLGWHVLEVLERRPSKQLTFDEAKDEIVQRLQMSYIAKELEDLRKKVKVEINEKALENLGGIPAAPAAKTPEAPAEEKPADNASK